MSELKMKLKHKDTEWRTGYAFYSGKTLRGVSECNPIQKIIVEHPESSFNKSPLLTKLTDRGSVTLTDTSLTKWEDGVVTKEEVDGERFRELAREIFGI